MFVACQRWRLGLDTYRPADETIRTSEFEVALIANHSVARKFIVENHYLPSLPQASFVYGMYRRDRLVGAAVFGRGATEASLKVVPGGPASGLILSRFLLLEEVPGNGETWFLARCFDGLKREGLTGVVSYSDPIKRTNRHGQTVFAGHIGNIYQAHNGIYLGRSKPGVELLFPDGTTLDQRSLSKLRGYGNGRTKSIQGWNGVVRRLVAQGADEPADSNRETVKEWSNHWVAKLTKPVDHPGKHKYAWCLEPKYRNRMPLSQRYPKWLTQQSWCDLCPIGA